MLCRDVVNGALRKLGRLGAGREPRTADQTDTLAALKGIYTSFIAAGTFGRISDIAPLGVDFTADRAWHVYRASPDTLAVNLPESGGYGDYGDPSEYGSRWVPPAYANAVGGRPPRDCTVVRITDDVTGLTRDFLFDGDYRAWASLGDLQLDDEAPLSRRNPEGLRAYLALQVADEFGAEVGQATAMLAKQFVGQLALGWSRPRTEVMWDGEDAEPLFLAKAPPAAPAPAVAPVLVSQWGEAEW